MHGAALLLPGVVKEVLRGRLGHEEQSILIGLIVCGDPHLAMLWTQWFLDHESPVWLACLLEGLLPVVSGPAGILATSEAKVDFLELVLRGLSERGVTHLLVPRDS